MKNKLIACVLIGTFSSQFALAQLHNIGMLNNDNILVQNSLTEVEAAHQQTRILFQTATTNDQKERLRYVNDRLDRAESLLRQVLNSPPSHPQPPPYQPPQPQPGDQVEMFKSDSCNGSLVGMVNPGTNCQAYANAAAVWAIKINGKCMDTLDMNAAQACETFKGAGNPNTLRVFKSDSCNGSLSAVISTATNCEALATDGSAWAVTIGGVCKDLADTSPKMACHSLRGAASPVNVEIYKSDSCNGSLVAIVDRYTQCQKLSGLSAAWAVKINGQCQDISDTDIVSACDRFKP